MGDQQFLIYRSSAGSGKTFNLAAEYLQLALQRPFYFRHILAVTFTNKATNEMKLRIIGELARMAAGDASSAMARRLCDNLGLGKAQIMEKSALVLQSVLHDYSHFAVTTIDSFFQKIIGSFARELGLQGGYEIELDIDKVLAETVDMLFLDLDQNPRLFKWMVRFTESKMEEERGWDVRREIIKLGKEVFKEFFTDLTQNMADPELLDELMTSLTRKKTLIENNLAGKAKAMLDRIQTAGLEVGDFAYGTNGVAGYINKISNKQIGDPGARVRDALENPRKWVAAKSGNKETITGLAETLLIPELKLLLDYYNQNIRQYRTYTEIIQFFYAFGLLSHISRCIRDYRDRKQVLLISDLSIFLKKIISDNDAPFIYEKAGIFYNHFLIDEFQDTSRVQWYNFVPLVKNSISQGYRNMVVGDIKQSIYRWRGGDWRILGQQVENDIGSEYITPISLNENWRSRENIIQFNNSFFRRAVTLLKEGKIGVTRDGELPVGNDKINYLKNLLDNAYADVAQHIPVKENETGGGTVNIRFIHDEPDAGAANPVSWKKLAMEELPGLLEKVQDHGFPLKDVAFLVRNNAEGKELASFLMSWAGSDKARAGYRYDIISSESLVLGSSHAVNVIVAALKYLVDPGDGMNRLRLVYHYAFLTGILTHTDPHWLFENAIIFPGSKQPGFDIFPEPFLKNLDTYMGLPLADKTGLLIEDLGLRNYPGELEYLFGFEDAVIEFLKYEKGDPVTFLSWWEEEGSERPVKIPSVQDAARIITIHKSKGLEFRVVVIPFCNWDLDHDSKKDNILWVNTDDLTGIGDAMVPVKYSARLAFTEFSDEYIEENTMACIDNLNLMYVAFTRASEGLFIYAKAPKNPLKEIKFKTSADLILQVMNEEPIIQKKDSEGMIGFSHFWNSEKMNFVIGELPVHAKQNQAETGISLRFFPSTIRDRHISILRKSLDYFKGSTEEKINRINYGNRIHEVLSRVIIKSDLEEAIRASRREGFLLQADETVINQVIQELMKLPIVDEWFSGEWKVKTEASVILPNGEIKRMDRVMEKDGEWVVLDYKTGVKSGGDKKQILEYLGILKDMGYKSVTGYLLYLARPELVKV